ncbi:unnamed protein product [Lampetra fluviatilis]
MLGPPELWRENGGGRRAAVKAASLSECLCTGRSGMAKPKRYAPLQGKRFYLDVQNQRQATQLERELQQLGGTLERFLSRDVNYLITSRREVATDSSGRPAAVAAVTAAAPLGGPLTPSSTSSTLGLGKTGSAAASLGVTVTTPVTSGGPTAIIGALNDERPTSSSTMQRTQTAQARTTKHCAFIERPTKEAPETGATAGSKQRQCAGVLNRFVAAVKFGGRSQPAPQLRNGCRAGIEGSDAKPSVTASQQQQQQQHKQQLVLQQQKKLHLPSLLVSRGKKLVQKAMKRQENVGADLLANARSWGVKIIHMDAALKYLEKKRCEAGNPPPPGPHVQPAPQPGSATTHKHISSIKLQKQFIKVEDCSQHYRPMFVQLGCFPWINTASPRGNCPFELEILPAGPSQQQLQEQKQQQELKIKQQKQPQQDQQQLLVMGNKRAETNANTKAAAKPSAYDGGCKRTGGPAQFPPCRPKHGYCECCCLTFQHMQSHMQNEGHRSFALDDTNYVELDAIICQLEMRSSASPTATLGSITPEFSRPMQVCQQERSRPSYRADTGAALMATLHGSGGGGSKGNRAAGIGSSGRKGDIGGRGEGGISGDGSKCGGDSGLSQTRPCATSIEAIDTACVGRTGSFSRASFSTKLPNDVMPLLSPCTVAESFSMLSHNNLEPLRLRAERVSAIANAATSRQSPVANCLSKSKKRKAKLTAELPPSKVARLDHSESGEGGIVMSTWNSGAGDMGCTAADADYSHGIRGCAGGGETLGHSMPTADAAPICQADDVNVLQVTDGTVDRTWLNGTEVQAEAPWWERNSALEATNEGGIPLYLQLLQIFRTSEVDSFEGFHLDGDGVQEQQEEQVAESAGSHEDKQGGPTLHIARDSRDEQDSTRYMGSGLPGDAAEHNSAADSTARTSTRNRTPTEASSKTAGLPGQPSSGQSGSRCSATSVQMTSGGDVKQLQEIAVSSKSSSEWDPLFPSRGKQRKVNGAYDNLRDVCVDVTDMGYQAHLDAVLGANLNPK